MAGGGKEAQAESSLAERIQRYRIERGLTQKMLARRLGLSAATIVNAEIGRSLSVTTGYALAQLVGEARDAYRPAKLADLLAELGWEFHRRGWVLGTSGNFSAVVRQQPFRLAITSTGVDKGALTAAQIVEIDATGQTLRGRGMPSAETLLHLAVVRMRGAGAVLHTHSVWSTILSEAFSRQGGIRIEGYEMLKGLSGVRAIAHREWLPIIENSDDHAALSQTVDRVLREQPNSHGFLLRRHGLYTCGKDLAEAKRHVEILEFLLEVLGRSYSAAGRELETAAGFGLSEGLPRAGKAEEHGYC
jgi:methylthioribulose-1-phosphate dehydratase